ncbi:uncharacterized protein LOC102805738 [Saccoglossus kowalevskii]|uniref:RNA polymerase II subunit B1 CTD phosphatase RPAP2 homolog n=1 Tax=Saccoglossus kowalevskii TaxID=10224 RepID=A0ABM0MN71_SACKO|nr:PREDICTED: putative RNA polymerase II subunit B1 CTD phosphatase RPAP2-like [Saccoglossus kowalevskii]
MSKAHKSRKKKGDPEIDPKRKASLEAKIRKQVACEERAFRIVEKLLDNPITEEYLIDCAKFITPSHYADITIERSVAKQCGYPVCENGLSNMPKQKYHISTHSNKIYDISERKCFCSNFCYKASKYFENQVPSSPVWTREGEIPPDITLLSKDKTTKKDFKIEGAGQEVVLISPKVKKEDINQVTVNPDDVPEVPLDELADDLSQLLITDEEHMSQIKDRADEETRFENKSEMNEVGTSCHGNQSNAGGLSASDKVPSEETHEDLCMELQNKQRSVVEKEDTAADESQQQKVGVVDNLEQRTKDSVTVKPKTKKRKPKKCLDVPINKSLPLEIVRKTLFEWRTVEAIRLVFGDETANKLAATQQELVQTLQQQSSQPSANTEIVNNLSDSSVNAVAQQQTEQLAQQSVNMSEEDRAKNKSVAGMPGEKDYGQLLQQQKSNKLVAGEKKISREEAIFEAKVQKFYRGTVLSKKEDVKREEKVL